MLLSKMFECIENIEIIKYFLYTYSVRERETYYKKQEIQDKIYITRYLGILDLKHGAKDSVNMVKLFISEGANVQQENDYVYV